MMYEEVIMRGIEIFHVRDVSECTVCRSLQKSDSLCLSSKPFVRRKCVRRIKKPNRIKMENNLEKCALVTMNILQIQINSQRNNLKTKMKQSQTGTDGTTTKKSNQATAWFSKWKFRKIHPLSTGRIQEIDGGFFEKFGSIFHENSALAAAKEKEEKDLHAQAAATLAEAAPESDDAEETNDIPESDGESPSSSDSEPDDKSQFISIALNTGDIVYALRLCLSLNALGAGAFLVNELFKNE